MNESRGGKRAGSGRKSSHPWLRRMAGATSINAAQLMALALEYCEQHEAGFLLWLNGQRSKARPASVAPRLTARKPR